MINYYHFIRPILFSLSPEVAHALSFRCLEVLAQLHIASPAIANNSPINLLGLTFPNPVGGAAGMDKNGDYIAGLAGLGFGFIELGTVTPKPQPGNAKPRMFRLPQADALINRLGFNNKGVDYLINKLQHHRRTCVIGINIGKNATTPIENAIEDYKFCLHKVYPFADYITVNISSPNTKHLRELQEGSMFINLLTSLKAQQAELADKYGIYKPLLVKIAPDLMDDQLHFIAEQLLLLKLDGVIATNTTVSRHNLSQYAIACESGGLSGAPLFDQSTQVVKKLRAALGKDFPIIGTGGIMSVQDAKNKLESGANLVQLYTGLVYHGPQLIKQIIRGL